MSDFYKFHIVVAFIQKITNQLYSYRALRLTHLHAEEHNLNSTDTHKRQIDDTTTNRIKTFLRWFLSIDKCNKLVKVNFPLRITLVAVLSEVLLEK